MRETFHTVWDGVGNRKNLGAFPKSNLCMSMYMPVIDRSISLLAGAFIKSKLSVLQEWCPMPGIGRKAKAKAKQVRALC